ncbi:MAG: hypothetical protein HXY27_04960 [Hydrogenophilaceae bacterium]|nr:hypothetical protein [Hydrogenophilaceae bacterium]
MNALIFLLAALNSPMVLSHSDEYLDTQPAPNGGQMRMAGAYHYELVVAKDSQAAKENPVVVFVTDHGGTKIPTAGARGTATILAGKLKATVNLMPDGDNRLKGYAKYASTPDMKGAVTLTLPGKKTESARFTPLAKTASDPHARHKH